MATNNRVNSNFHQIGIEDANGNVTGIEVGTFTATSTVYLGTVTNVTITGGSNGNVLTTDGAGNLSWGAGGGGGTPGGTDTQVQFNDGGVFGGDSAFTWNKSSDTLTLAGDITAVDSITFDTTASETSAVAKLYWDNGDGTLSSGLKGGNVTARLGQNLYTLVYNAEASTITKGQVVYIFGAQGQRPSVKLAQADADATSARTFGVVAENIASGAEGFVCIEGDVDNINTLGLTEGGQLYLSGTTPGGYTQTKPQAPIHLVYVGICLKASSTAGRIQVKVQNGYELDELHDVRITTPVANNSILQYQSTSTLWVNSSPSTAINSLLPTQTGNTGTFLKTDGSTASWAYAVTGAAGTDTQIQFNSGGLFAADSGLTYTTAANTDTLFVGDTNSGGQLQLQSGTQSSSYTNFIFDNSVSTTATITAPSYNTTPPYGSSGPGKSIIISGGDGLAGTGPSGIIAGSGGGVVLKGGGVTGFGNPGSATLQSGTNTFTVSSSIFINSNAGTAGQLLTSNGFSSMPTWTTPSITSFTGTLAATNGGTSQSTYATGDILYASASNTLSKRSIGTSGQILTVSGGVPTWVTATYATVDDSIVYAIALGG